MHSVVPLPTVVRDAILLFELVHGEDVGYPVWDVPYVHRAVVSHLVRSHHSRVTVDLHTSLHRADVVEILLALECCHGRTSVEVCSVVRQLVCL